MKDTLPLRFSSTTHERTLVAESVERLEPLVPVLCKHFYEKLFLLDTAAQAFFKGSLPFRQRKFANLFLTFRSIKHLDNLVPLIRAMGDRHRSHHRQFQTFFPAMRTALLDAIRDILGGDFTVELAGAWARVYDDVAAIMQQAATPAEPERRGATRPAWTGAERRTGWLPRTDEGLLVEIGGVETVRRVHQRFYDAVFEDPWLGQFFHGKSKPLLIEKQTQFMVAAFGGQHDYRGATPAMVHMHMLITEDVADLRERYLRQAILAQGLSEAIADRWQAVDRLFRPAIIKHGPDQCVLLCMGQIPVTAVKPLHYNEPFAQEPRDNGDERP